MAKKWAIVIGIDQYKRLQPLRHAERDAQAMRDFLVGDAKFEHVYYFTDRSPKIVLEGISISTQPTMANLQRFLELRFAAPFLKQGDTLWFFFSGYGLQYANADYLLPSDAVPEATETTAITIDAVADCLSRSGTHHIVLFLDACRTEEQKFGQGFGTDPQGVVSVFSTAFGETTRDLEALHLGSFTYTLLEGLSLHSNNPNATVAQLVQYLCDRLPQVNRRYGQPPQSPRLSAKAAIAPEAMLLPQVTSRDSKLQPVKVQTLPAGRKRASIGKRQRSSKTLQTGVASCLVLAIGATGVAMYREVNRYLDASTVRAGTASASAPATTFSLRNDFDQRLPRPGTYSTTTSLLNQSHREISKANGRFCIKLVNAPTAAARNQQIIVSTLSFREDGAYIDATQERLQINGTSEITDSKSTWQWSKTEVDRAGLVAKCLSSTTSYVREVKGGIRN